MSKSSFNWPDYFPTDAVFRAWGLQLSNALAAAGLVKQAVPGAIDWTTVLKPTTGSTWGGWEIWALSDSLQVANPVFIKIYYGTASAAVWPKVSIYAGFGYDGSGAFTGNSYGVEALGVSLPLPGSFPTYVAGDGSGVVIHFLDGRGNANDNCSIFALERTRDASGALDARGIYLAKIGRLSTTNISCYIPRTGLFNGYMGTNCVLPVSSTGADGTSSNLYPIRVQAKAEQTPMSLIAGYFTADLTTGNPLAVTRWDGQVRTFLPLADSRFPQGPGLTVANTTGTAIFWE